MTRLRFKSTN